VAVAPKVAWSRNLAKSEGPPLVPPPPPPPELGRKNHPRISPPGKLAVWTLAYSRPLLSAATISAGCIPAVGWKIHKRFETWPSGWSRSRRAPGALFPGSAGPWTWAAVSGVLRFEKLKDTRAAVSSGERTIVAEPVAVDVVGGTSEGPFKFATNVL